MVVYRDISQINRFHNLAIYADILDWILDHFSFLSHSPMCQSLLLVQSSFIHVSFLIIQFLLMGFAGAYGKESACQCRRYKRRGFDPWVRKIPWSRKWQPTLVFLPGKFHGQRSLEGCSPWGQKESHMTKYREEWIQTMSKAKYLYLVT